MFKPRGIIPPHITPFTRDGAIDEKALREDVDFWVEAKVHGLATCASNGEAAYMSGEERERVISIVIDQSNGRVPIVVGTGAPSTREAVAQTKAARNLGADAALVVTPYFLSPKQEEILQYYKDIVEAVDVPVILYNVPKFTAVNMEPWVVAKLAEHDNVVGVKDSSGDMRQMQSLLNLVGEKISVLSGVGNLIFPNLASGGQGGIVAVANVVPAKCVEIYNSTTKNDLKTASRSQAEIVDLNDFLTRQYGVPAIKAALNLLGHPGGYPRRPLLPLPDKRVEELRSILTDLRLVM